MKKLILILLILYAGNAAASSLPNCPSDQSERYHNCFGTFNLGNISKYVGEFKKRTRTYFLKKYVGEKQKRTGPHFYQWR